MATKMPIPAHVLERMDSLRRFANRTAGFYGCPIYLVGSACYGDNPNPRDWDLRIEMPDEDFAVRFGDVQAWITEGGSGLWTDVRWKWSKCCTKETHAAWNSTGLNVDFQIYPLSYCKLHYPRNVLPRIRIDEMPRSCN